jgi:RHS repeat-associated protein
MLLPGRYVSDTTKRCMTISKSNWTTVLVDTCISAYSLSSAMSTTGTASSSTSGGNLVLTAPEASDMLVLTQNVVAGVSNTIQLDINRLTGGNDNGVQVVIVEEINNIEYVIGSGYLQQGSKQTLTFTPTFDVAKLKIYGPFDEMLIGTTCTKKAATVQHTYLVDVCDEDKDRYRFGFNGMEKVNEIAGVGNSLDFGARMYDSRIGKFLSLDPLMSNFPFYSPYQFAGNTPIMAIDEEGKALKIVTHHTKIAPDGAKIIVKTATQINKEWIYKSGKEAYSATVVYEVDEQGRQTQVGTLVEREATKNGEMKSSANYDYTQEVIDGKMSEDIDYYKSGTKGWFGDRMVEVYNRDVNAPDNAMTVNDINDLKTILSRKVAKNNSASQNSGDGIIENSQGKNGQKINQKRKASWAAKESQLREQLKGAKTKTEKKQIQKQIDHAVNQQKKSENHSGANKR